MTRLHLEPEGIASPGGLVSDLLEGEPGALGLFPAAVFQQPAVIACDPGHPGVADVCTDAAAGFSHSRYISSVSVTWFETS